MKKLIRPTSILLVLSFSIYCFCFLNAQDQQDSPQTEASVVNQHIIDEVEENAQETYFPDLKLVQRVSNLIAQVFKVI